MKSAFQKISRVSSITGGTKWYLSQDCLLAAKRTMYAVEYRRFYLRDLECIVVWPSRSWLFRIVITGMLFTALGASLWQWVNSTAGAIFIGLAAAWIALELALGPTAGSRVGTMGVSIDLALVKRTRRARKVLAVIDAAVRSCREVTRPPVVAITSLQPAEVSVHTKSEAASPPSSIANASETSNF